MPPRIAILDCGMGNLHSVVKRLSPLGCDVNVTADPRELPAADKIILPGVGHFRKAMSNLKKLDLQDALNEAVLIGRKPILGICLGMQLLAKRSEEGEADGLGWIDAQVVKFRTDNKLKFKIPHVGWNQIAVSKDSRLMQGIDTGAEFYFVHSYYLKPNCPADVLNETEYEHRFTSAIERGNVFGVQYHPEKSRDVGEKLLRNFVDL